MVPPAAADLQVAPRCALEREAETFDEPDRARVRGLDARLEPVQLQLSERLRDHEPQSLVHVSPARVGLERVVAERARAARVADDVVDVHDADELVRVAVDDEKRRLRRAPRAAQVLRVLVV